MSDCLIRVYLLFAFVMMLSVAMRKGIVLMFDLYFYLFIYFFPPLCLKYNPCSLAQLDMI